MSIEIKEPKIAEQIWERRIGLVVGLPFVGRPVVPEWALSLAAQSYPLNTNVQFSAVKFQPIDISRNEIVENAIKNSARYIWFLDDDVAPPFWACRRLISTLENADSRTMVAGGIYCAKWEPTEPVVYRGDGMGAFWKWKRGDVFEVSSIGTGCMVIKTELFQHLEPPYFKTIDKEVHDDPDGLMRVSETDDIYFCQKVIGAGYKIVADGSVLCVHWDVSTGKYYALPDDSYPMTPREKADAA